MDVDTAPLAPAGAQVAEEHRARRHRDLHADQGQLHGTMQAFDDKGLLVQSAEFVKGQQHGVTRVYTQGLLLSEQTFQAGMLNGPAQSFDAAGEVSCRMQYAGGELEGPVEYYLMEELTYRDGRPVGEPRRHADSSPSGGESALGWPARLMQWFRG